MSTLLIPLSFLRAICPKKPRASHSVVKTATKLTEADYFALADIEDISPVHGLNAFAATPARPGFPSTPAMVSVYGRFGVSNVPQSLFDHWIKSGWITETAYLTETGRRALREWEGVA